MLSKSKRIVDMRKKNVSEYNLVANEAVVVLSLCAATVAEEVE